MVQKLLIARAAKLVVVIELLERRLIEEGIGDLAGRQLLAWVNTLRRTLQVLGVERPQQMPKKLADVLKVA